MRATLTSTDNTLQNVEHLAHEIAPLLCKGAKLLAVGSAKAKPDANFLWLSNVQTEQDFAISAAGQGWLSAAREKLCLLQRYSLLQSGKFSLADQPEEIENWKYYNLNFYHQGQNLQHGMLIDPDNAQQTLALNDRLKQWEHIRLKLSCHVLLRAKPDGGYRVMAVRVGRFPDGASIIADIQDIIYGNLVIGGIMRVDFDSTFPLALEIGQIELPLKDALQLRAGSELAIECKFPLEARLKLADQKWADVELSVQDGGLKVKVI